MKVERINVLTAAAFFLITVLSATGQVMSPLPAGEQAVCAGIGLDPAIIFSAGYARGIRFDAINRDLLVSAEIAFPIAELDFKDNRIKTGIQMSIVSRNGWDFSTAIHAIFRGTENWMHRASNIGFDVAALGGFYGKKWFSALELCYDKALMTKITATDAYRDEVYSEFKDGWYINTGGYFQAGLRAGLQLGHLELKLRSGLQRTERFESMTVPFFADLGVNYRF
ncbi:MAG: hypothetical protein JSV89_19410 [Spirochaetaceae bacterium]|nr:MAG: hypothetical protein JSV89_19410 [Spirochaetaceae bacterium]